MCATTAQTGGGAWSEEEGHHGYNSRAQNDIIIGRNRPRSVPSSVVNNILLARPSRMRHNYYVDDDAAHRVRAVFIRPRPQECVLYRMGIFSSREKRRETRQRL